MTTGSRSSLADEANNVASVRGSSEAATTAAADDLGDKTAESGETTPMILASSEERPDYHQADDDDDVTIASSTATRRVSTTTASATTDMKNLNGPTGQPPPQPPTERSRLLAAAMKLPLASCCSALLTTRNLRVDLLAILFGIGSWIGVNSVYLQLPLFVAHAPEGWSLPSFLVIVIQCGNIGPLVYTLVQRWSPRKPNDSHLIYGIYALGVAAAICMATLYRETAVVAGERRSVALLAITFLFALIGCTSSVLFMPYMGRFKEIYLITYLVGEGLSGFLPSVLTLAQGVGGNTVCVADPAGGGGQVQWTPPPRFESDVFFYLIFALMACSAVAFGLLDRLRLCRKEYASVTIRHGNDYNYDKASMKAEAANGGGGELGEAVKSTNGADEDDAVAPDVKRLSTGNYVFLMAVMAVVSCFGSGIYPSLQSYSCLPYGNLAYHLTVTLSSIANPLACFAAVFLPHHSIRHIVWLCGAMGALTAYALATAVMSPEPPMRTLWIGDLLVVFTWVALTALVSYIKLSITSIFRFQGGQSLVWIGAISQAGSACGAVISFCLVNLTAIFVAYQPC